AAVCSGAWAVTEEARRRSERRFQTVFASQMVPTMIGHLDGRVLDANLAWLRLVGATREELDRGELRWTDFLVPERRATLGERVAELRAAGHLGPYESEYLRRDS